jgi:transposase
MDLVDFLPSDDLVIDELRWSSTTATVTLMASLVPTTASCPRCQTPSARVHSRYTRTLADLPWGPYQMTMILHVRRFRCPATPCLQQIFAERLPAIVAPFARRTVRLQVLQHQLGLLLGGVLGATVSHTTLGPVSRTTVLRFVQHAPDPLSPPPTVIGIDDWAFRKRTTYGTIVVDLERGTVLDLLPDRTSETVAAWLAAHPTIQIVSRDRAQAYGEGIRQGAPNAIQVADRWHLVRNVVTALETVLIQQAPQWEASLRTLLAADTAPSAALPTVEPAVSPAAEPPSGCPHRRAHREARFTTVRELAAAGQSLRSIARTTGLSRNTVRSYVRADHAPTYARRRRRASVLDPYKPYVQERWTTAACTVQSLFADLRTQGYPGKYSILKAYIATLRTPESTPAPVLPRPREIIGWICQPAHGGVSDALFLTEDFLTMVRERQRQRFGSWLDDAGTSGLKAFQAVARSMQQDAAAVGAGLELPWSTGPVEGHINRLKYLKRQMFGRASLALLRKRVQYRPKVGGSDHQERA